MKPQKKIFIADDDAGILDALQMMLEDTGYEVETSVDGGAIYTMKDSYPDMFILDIWMSGVDGRDLCKYIKSQENLKLIPVVMISANKDTAEIAKKAGADGYVNKPFEMDELLGTIAKHLTERRPIHG